ncbi:MAG: hypothetical protein AAF840_10800, partial [Bacteroidota bacterium]
MEDRLLDKIAEPFNLNLPEYESMEVMIDSLLPVVSRFSENSLLEEEAPMYTRDWIKMTDEPGRKVYSLHTFIPGSGEVRIANDGKMDALSFKVLTKRRMILGQSVHRDAFLYELAFMDNDFLILKRHGNTNNFDKKYLFWCREAIGTRLEWNEALEQMADKYRNNEFPWWIVIVALAVL